MKRRKSNPPKFERCVKSVKRSLKKYKRPGNAYAICSAMRSNPTRWNPMIPLDPTSFLLTPQVLSAIEGQREKIARTFGRKPRKNLTDRAKRYRAQKHEPRTGRCFACGNPKTRDIHHLNGRESDGDPDNLTRACRSCNIRIGNVMRRAGLGTKTVQFNKGRSSGASSLGAYLSAVQILKGDAPGNVADAVRTVRATSKSQRSSFAKQIWEKRRDRYGDSGRANGLKRNRGRMNSVPKAEERYQRFHGRPSEQLVKVRTTLHSHDVLAGIGDLRKLKIKSANGHWKVTVKFLKPYPILSMNEAATQLYIEGGDQSVDLRDFGIKTPHEKEVLGQVTDVWYFTRKDHLRPEDGGTAIYHHKFGKIKPTMVYDVPNQLMEFAGGGYTIPDEGIDQ